MSTRAPGPQSAVYRAAVFASCAASASEAGPQETVPYMRFTSTQRTPSLPATVTPAGSSKTTSGVDRLSPSRSRRRSRSVRNRTPSARSLRSSVRSMRSTSSMVRCLGRPCMSWRHAQTNSAQSRAPSSRPKRATSRLACEGSRRVCGEAARWSLKPSRRAAAAASVPTKATVCSTTLRDSTLERPYLCRTRARTTSRGAVWKAMAQSRRRPRASPS
mmetsp:Transcript_2000/g.6642  ORF Transcript_2000/g.6642 Transcript_2000/m.6642 type:complete len:217 (+) Transcript_2000:142-792(+)